MTRFINRGVKKKLIRTRNFAVMMAILNEKAKGGAKNYGNCQAKESAFFAFIYPAIKKRNNKKVTWGDINTYFRGNKKIPPLFFLRLLIITSYTFIARLSCEHKTNFLFYTSLRKKKQRAKRFFSDFLFMQASFSSSPSSLSCIYLCNDINSRCNRVPFFFYFLLAQSRNFS